MPYTDHQPDKGGHMASAKATRALPFANPPADEPKDEDLNASGAKISGSQPGDNGHKGNVRHT
jgi:hypothetical protein